MPEYNKKLDPLLVAWEIVPFDFCRFGILLRLHLAIQVLAANDILLPVSLDKFDDRLTTHDLTLICESVEQIRSLLPTNN